MTWKPCHISRLLSTRRLGLRFHPDIQCNKTVTLSRWRPVASLGAPHCTSAEDTYEGMYIPQGSTVFANIAWVFCDPSSRILVSVFDIISLTDTVQLVKMKRFEHYLYYMANDGSSWVSGSHPQRTSTQTVISNAENPKKWVNLPGRLSSSGLGEESVLECTLPTTLFSLSFQGEQFDAFLCVNLTKCLVGVRLLWAFDIMPGLDSSGNPVLPSKDDSIGSLLVRPRPFFYELCFRRSGDSKALILNESKEAQEMALAWV